MSPTPTPDTPTKPINDRAAARVGSRRNALFFASLGALTAAYVLLLVAMIVAMLSFTSPDNLASVFADHNIRYAALLSLITCTISAILSVLIAVPTGYLLARFNFPGKQAIDMIVDIPIVLPPLVVGIALLILFQTIPGRWFESHAFEVTYMIPGVILAQFTVACAFAIRTMRVAFEQIDPRHEAVARTLGCSRASAFLRVTLPEAWPGVVAAFTIAWARALGEFGPVLVFAGATRMRTEVLPTTVYLEFSLGNLDNALAVSILMLLVAVAVLGITRTIGLRSLRQMEPTR